MKVMIDSLNERGRTITLDGAWVTPTISEAVEAIVESVTGKLQIRRIGSRIEVSGDISLCAPKICERCGEDVKLALDIPVSLIYVPEQQSTFSPSEEQDDETDEANEEDIVGWYQGDELDVAQIVTEAVALALPLRISCADEIACDERTQKLLREKGSSGDSTHPAFAGLRKLR